MTTIKFLSVCYISTLYYTNIDHFPREIPLFNRKLQKRQWNICNVAHFAFVVDNMVVYDRIIWNIGIDIWGSVLSWSYGSNHRCIVCKFAIVEDVFSVLQILANIKHNHAGDDEYALCRLSEYSWHFRLFFSENYSLQDWNSKILMFSWALSIFAMPYHISIHLMCNFMRELPACTST